MFIYNEPRTDAQQTFWLMKNSRHLYCQCCKFIHIHSYIHTYIYIYIYIMIVKFYFLWTFLAIISYLASCFISNWSDLDSWKCSKRQLCRRPCLVLLDLGPVFLLFFYITPLNSHLFICNRPVGARTLSTRC